MLYLFVFKFTDVDECEEIPGICGKYTICFNTNGSYFCQCKSGFINNRGTVNFTGIDGQCQGEYACAYV